MVKVYKSEKGGREIQETYDILLNKWDVEYEEKDVETRYGTTHVVMAGAKDNLPLVLFHGVGDDAAFMWIRNAKAWAKDFRIYAVDTMGGPGKSVPNENYGKEFNICPWLDDVLESLGLNKVNMAGVSNGAYITQAYGSRRPEKTEKLVCMAGGLRIGDKPPGFFEIMKQMKVFFPEAIFPTKKNMLKLIDKLCGGNSQEFSRDKDFMRHWEALLKHFNKMAMGFHKIEPLNEDEAASLRGRTLFLLGDKDPIAYSGESVKILRENGISLEIIENSGHALNYEMPGRINALAGEFLKDSLTM